MRHERSPSVCRHKVDGLKHILFFLIFSFALDVRAEPRAILEIFRSGPQRNQERYVLYDAEKGREELMKTTNALDLETNEVGVYRRPTRNTAERLNDLMEKDDSSHPHFPHVRALPFPIHQSWRVYILGREISVTDPRRSEAIQILLGEVKKSGWKKLDVANVTLNSDKAIIQRTVSSSYTTNSSTHPKPSVQAVALRKVCTRDANLLRCTTDNGYVFFIPK